MFALALEPVRVHATGSTLEFRSYCVLEATNTATVLAMTSSAVPARHAMLGSPLSQ